mgnify:FL=1
MKITRNRLRRLISETMKPTIAQIKAAQGDDNDSSDDYSSFVSDVFGGNDERSGFEGDPEYLSGDVDQDLDPEYAPKHLGGGQNASNAEDMQRMLADKQRARQMVIELDRRFEAGRKNGDSRVYGSGAHDRNSPYHKMDALISNLDLNYAEALMLLGSVLERYLH